jgi:hypothetical protein
MIFDKPILTKANIAYFCIALIFGTILAFGIASITYQPLPLQVQENPYAPVKPPAPAIVTQAPQYVPGSSADNHKNDIPDQYAPVLPPVIVTTQPLPTATPAMVVITAPSSTTLRTCTYESSSTIASGEYTECIVEESMLATVNFAASWMPLLFGLFTFIGLFSSMSRTLGRRRYVVVIVGLQIAIFYSLGWF